MSKAVIGRTRDGPQCDIPFRTCAGPFDNPRHARLARPERAAPEAQQAVEEEGLPGDVDLLVEFEPDAHAGLLLLSRMQRELAELFRRPVDLVPRDGLKPAIREAVLAAAQVIYAA